MMRFSRPNPHPGDSNADAAKTEYRLVKQFFASIALACCMLDASAQNMAPTVSLGPLPATVAAPGTIPLNASASDADGTVDKVEFFNGTALLATVTQAPYSYQWTGVAAGTYAITARVTDNLGAQTVTPASTVTVASGAAQVYYIYSDQVNTAKEIVNAAGAKVWQSDTEPFGANPPNENPAGQGQFTYNQRFPGQYFDRETGLHYNYHRDYDPQTGRYLQSDPIGLRGGINTYGYVRGNPVGLVDPMGLVDIYVGGAKDGTTKIVSSWVDENATGSAYFEWTQGAELSEYISKVPADEPINLYGHSYGGDTAAWAAMRAAGRVNSLTTLDPVSRFKPDFNKLRCSVGTWRNVNATPSQSDRTDTVAWWGGKWGSRPRGIATSYAEANVNHGDFGGLMKGIDTSSSDACDCSAK